MTVKHSDSVKTTRVRVYSYNAVSLFTKFRTNFLRSILGLGSRRHDNQDNNNQPKTLSIKVAFSIK